MLFAAYTNREHPDNLKPEPAEAEAGAGAGAEAEAGAGAGVEVEVEVEVEAEAEAEAEVETKKEGTKRLVVLVSNSTVDPKEQADQRRALVLLEAVGIYPEKLDGGDPGQAERRNKLFEVSGVKASYPQFFVVDDDETPQFIGQYEDIRAMADEDKLTRIDLGLSAEDLHHPETAFIGAPVEKYQSDPKPVDASNWEKKEEKEDPQAESVEHIYVSDSEGEEMLVDEDGNEMFEEEVVEEDGSESEEVIFEDEDRVPQERNNDTTDDDHTSQGVEKSDDDWDNDELFVASKEDLFPEDPFEESFATRTDESSEHEDLLAIKPEELSDDSSKMKQETLAAAKPEEPYNDSPAGRKDRAAAPQDVEKGIDTDIRDLDLDAQARKADAGRRKEKAARTAASDFKFHLLVGMLVVLLFGGGLAAVLVLTIFDDDDEQNR
jgi:hypothetical protein